MRRTTTALTLALLASAGVLGSVSFASAADACWFVRMPASERPPCCDLSAKDRFTMPGGDCCRSLLHDLGDPVEFHVASLEVPPAAVAPFVRTWSPRHTRLSAANTLNRARAPPLIRRVTETIVLRV